MDKSTTAGELKTLRSQHQQAQSQLDKYKLLVDSVQDYAIFLMDKDGYIQTWNKGAEKNKGYKPDDIIGQHFSIFYLERDKKAKKPERELELAKKFSRVEDEDWRLRKDGSQFWANVVITALYDNDELVGFAKVTRDLTERKQQEDSLRHANALLRKQQFELERLSVSKDEFISLASHQLRTPATAIKQLLGMLLEGFKGDINPEQRATIQKAYESNERQISTVNSLLRVAQIDAGKVILQKTLVAVDTLIRDVIDEQHDIIQKRGQSIHVDTPIGLSPILVDPGHFRMALANLLDNASKYTHEGGDITIAAREDKDVVSIAVTDTGVGIAEEDMDKLFTKFSRIPNELSDKSGGSGLGLYWVYKVVGLHDGELTVDSEVNEGTTFRIKIPVKSEHA